VESSPWLFTLLNAKRDKMLYYSNEPKSGFTKEHGDYKIKSGAKKSEEIILPSCHAIPVQLIFGDNIKNPSKSV
jgi:hypothetical protein